MLTRITQASRGDADILKRLHPELGRWFHRRFGRQTLLRNHASPVANHNHSARATHRRTKKTQTWV